MDSEKLKCVIKLGSLKLSCIIAQLHEDSSIKIIGSSTTASKGIHNGAIVSLDEAMTSIRSCLSEAESKANVSLKKINVVLEMPEFVCTRFSKHKKIDGSKIHKDDIEFLLKESKKEASYNDTKKSIIHIFNHNYVVDGKEFIKEPINVHADSLNHEMTFITIPKNLIKNINQIFNECDLEIERFISNTFALAVHYLNDTSFELGSTLIDIGHDKTSLGIFKKFALIHSITFPIGTNHVTKDISRLCSLTLEESENIKNQMGCFIWNENSNLDKENNLSKKFFIESKFRKISKSLVSQIITARINEILEIVRKEVHLTGLEKTSGQNIYITGGGSNILYLKEFCLNFFNRDVKIFKSSNNNDYFLDSCHGALKIIYSGWETEALPEIVDKRYEKQGFLSKIFGNRV